MTGSKVQEKPAQRYITSKVWTSNTDGLAFYMTARFFAKAQQYLRKWRDPIVRISNVPAAVSKVFREQTTVF